MSRIAVLGCGTMAGAIVSGLLGAGAEASQITATARSREHRDQISAEFGVAVTEDNRAAVRGAGVVLLGVKPYATAEVAAEVADALEPGAVVVSIAAGVTIAALSRALEPSGGRPVVRVMPNTPVKVGRGTFIVSPAPGASDAGRAVKSLLAPLGTVVEVPENLHDAATAVSGSGPAYVFLVAEAMVDAAVAMGIPRPQATELTVSTLAGSAELMAATGDHPAVLRAQVTSPGGTTAAALDQLESHGVRTAFARALEACRDRAAAMGA